MENLNPSESKPKKKNQLGEVGRSVIGASAVAAYAAGFGAVAVESNRVPEAEAFVEQFKGVTTEENEELGRLRHAAEVIARIVVVDAEGYNIAINNGTADEQADALERAADQMARLTAIDESVRTEQESHKLQRLQEMALQVSEIMHTTVRIENDVAHVDSSDVILRNAAERIRSLREKAHY